MERGTNDNERSDRTEETQLELLSHTSIAGVHEMSRRQSG